MNLKLLAPACAVCLAVLAATAYGSSNGTDATGPAPNNGTSAELPANITIMETDGMLHTIPLEDIRYGGVPKDGIPSIDSPYSKTPPTPRSWTTPTWS